MNALTTPQSTTQPTANPYQGMGMLDPTVFDHMYRVGKVLALSPLFPEHLRKGDRDQAIANGILVINMAIRLREDPLTVAQAIYFVGGKPGWSASYMIAKANQHGVFKNPIDWEVKGRGTDLSVTAFAELAGTGKRVAVTCDMAMAKSEGWTKNAKYTSMPEQMLRYRSATFLIRLYCPEVMVGIPSQVELEMPSIRDITPGEPAVVESDAASQEEANRALERERTSTADNAAREAEQKRRDEAAAALAAADERDRANAAKAAAAKAAADEAASQKATTQQQNGGSDRDTGRDTGRDDGEMRIDRDVLEGIAQMVMRDLNDVHSQSDADEVLSFYDNQLRAVKSQATDLWATIEAAYNSKRA